MIEHTETEYAVEVPGRGWYVGAMPAHLSVLLTKPPEHGVRTLAEADDLAYGLRNRYHALGCPEIAETVRVVSRTVTVTRPDWTALVEVSS